MPRQLCSILVLLLLPVVQDRGLAAQSLAVERGADAQTLTRLAEERLAGGDEREARVLLGRALALSPNAPEANDTLGEILLRENHYPEAMDRFETTLAINLTDARARTGELAAATRLAMRARADGNSLAAYKALEHARLALPDDTTLLTELGIQALEMKLLAPAAEALTQAIARTPGDPTALYALARVEIEQDRLPAAEQHLRAYLVARPDDATAHYGLGHMLQTQLRLEAATAEFSRSLELQPVQTESYYQLGEIALEGRRDEEAKRYFDQVLSRSGTHGGALAGLGIVAYRGRDYLTARRLLMRATQAAPEYQRAHYYLGLTMGHLGEAAASRGELEMATKLAHQQQGKSQPIQSALP